MIKLVTIVSIICSFSAFSSEIEALNINGLKSPIVNQLKINLWTHGLSSEVAFEELRHDESFNEAQQILKHLEKDSTNSKDEHFNMKRNPSHEEQQPPRFAYTEELMTAISIIDLPYIGEFFI